MLSWPLERVSYFDERLFLAILQSMTQAAVSKRAPLALPAMPLAAFAQTRWHDLGCDEHMLQEIVTQWNAMFGIVHNMPLLDTYPQHMAEESLQAWQCGARTITFFTSGSTGIPKPCTHTEDALRQEITSIAPLMHMCASALVTVPIYHMYGFTFGLLLPISLGLPVRHVPALPTVVAAHMQTGDMIVGVPYLWSRLAESGVLQAVHQQEQAGQGIAILSATSPLAAYVYLYLQEKGFCVREFFGASEMGAVATRTSHNACFTLLPHVQKQHDYALTRHLSHGEDRTYPLLDTVAWEGDSAFYPQGRGDNAVQVAGINVYPQYVQKILEEHTGVRQCSVRLMRPEEGLRLKAFIVPHDAGATKQLLTELRAFARRHLKPAERPAHYTFGANVPRGTLGKPCDW